MLLSMASFALADTTPINEVNLGDNTDLTAMVRFVYHRTRLSDKLDGYEKKFSKIYPNITVEYELITDFAENALLRIGSNDWTIMGIPDVDKDISRCTPTTRLAGPWTRGTTISGVPRPATAPVLPAADIV